MLVVMAIIYLADGGQSQLQTGSVSDYLPAFTGIASIVLIVSNFLAYAGIEVNAVHVTDMINPRKGLPKSIGLASILTLVGILASVVTSIPGPSRGLLLVARGGYLPRALQKTNGAGVQVNILIVQGILVSILALFFAVIPDVNSAFWILTAIAVQLDLIVYMILFMTALKLRRTQPEVPRGSRAPAMRLVCWVGFLASLLAFLIGFFHPPGSSMNNVVHISLLLLGIVILGGGPLPFFRFRKSPWDTTNDCLRT